MDAGELNDRALDEIDAFHHTGSIAALERAIESFLRAVECTGPSSPDRAQYCSNLGAARQDLYERTGDPAILEMAVSACRAAVDAAAEADEELPRYLSNLSNSLRSWFECTSDLAALGEAVRAGRLAAELAADADANSGAYLVNLSIVLEALADATAGPGVLARGGGDGPPGGGRHRGREPGLRLLPDQPQRHPAAVVGADR